MIHLMPCRNPCRLHIHHAFTYSVGPSSIVWVNWDRLCLFHQWECWKCNGHGLSVLCEVALTRIAQFEDIFQGSPLLPLNFCWIGTSNMLIIWLDNISVALVICTFEHAKDVQLMPNRWMDGWMSLSNIGMSIITFSTNEVCRSGMATKQSI